jgi:hypothetical protein
MKIEKEKKMITDMIGIYCRQKHGAAVKGELCPECEKLREYAYARLSKCPHGNEKPFCSECPVHCYKPDMREKIREVMRFSGQRMIFVHPIAAFSHMAAILRGKRKAGKNNKVMKEKK